MLLCMYDVLVAILCCFRMVCHSCFIGPNALMFKGCEMSSELTSWQNGIAVEY